MCTCTHTYDTHTHTHSYIHLHTKVIATTTRKPNQTHFVSGILHSQERLLHNIRLKWRHYSWIVLLVVFCPLADYIVPSFTIRTGSHSVAIVSVFQDGNNFSDWLKINVALLVLSYTQICWDGELYTCFATLKIF